ncbi:peptidyl-prolyl cis-trans isomerase FKBP8 [Aplysia californica]|uniref:peptidylprolyl isomerase n=1 Tax=Aplysia californica TaxID=6500 RepID=A0ABM0K719_APLCA|nr:peptidyl-prolyl cis-trans isomerase FKBP8 [Aplysia californica]
METTKDSIQDEKSENGMTSTPSVPRDTQEKEEDSLITDSLDDDPSESSDLKNSDSMPDLIWPDKSAKKGTSDSTVAPSTSHDTGFNSDSAVSTPSPDGDKQIVPGSEDTVGENLTGSESKDSVVDDEEKDGSMDILGNGFLKKKVLVPGKEDTRPTNGDTVTIRVDGVLENGTHVDVQDFTFILNDGDVILAFDLAVALMDVGEKCELFTDARYAYGPLGRDPDIPKDASITYTIELINVQPEQELSSLGTEKRLSMGEAKRERGNYLYGRQDYTGAISSYSKAVKILDDSDLNAGLDDEARSTLSESWVKCYNNMAACQLKISAIDAAIRSCEKVLSAQEDNVKALFRLGKAYSAKNEVDKALEYLRKGIKLDPESKMLHQEVLNLARRKSKESESEKELYQRMLGVKPGENPFTPGKTQQKKSNGVMKWILVAGSLAAAAASIGFSWYRTS